MIVTDHKGSAKVLRDEGFAKRLDSAMKLHLHAPTAHGRMSWLMHRINDKTGDSVTLEAVRKWFTGHMRPRPAKLAIIAEILEVSEAWLSLGITDGLKPRERRARNALADGAVNLVAGMIQMTGGTVAFPEHGDVRAEQENIDIYAIVKGGNFSIGVVYCSSENGRDFSIPNSFLNLTVIGVVRTGHLSFDCYEIDSELIVELGKGTGGEITLSIPADRIKSLQIKTFAERNFGRN